MEMLNSSIGTDNVMAKHFAAALCLGVTEGDYLWVNGQEPPVEVCEAIIPVLAARNLRPVAVVDGVKVVHWVMPVEIADGAGVQS